MVTMIITNVYDFLCIKSFWNSVIALNVLTMHMEKRCIWRSQDWDICTGNIYSMRGDTDKISKRHPRIHTRQKISPGQKSGLPQEKCTSIDDLSTCFLPDVLVLPLPVCGKYSEIQ